MYSKKINKSFQIQTTCGENQKKLCNLFQMLHYSKTILEIFPTHFTSQTHSMWNANGVEVISKLRVIKESI